MHDIETRAMYNNNKKRNKIPSNKAHETRATDFLGDAEPIKYRENKTLVLVFYYNRSDGFQTIHSRTHDTKYSMANP